MLPYQTVLAVACVVLAMLYLLDTDASLLGRVAVAVTTLASFLMPASTLGHILGIVAQLGVALFGLFRLKLLSADQ